MLRKRGGARRGCPPLDSPLKVAKEAVKENLNVFEKMKAISKAYTTKLECFVQEAVYHIMPELWLRKTFPGVVFANSNLPEHRYSPKS